MIFEEWWSQGAALYTLNFPFNGLTHMDVFSLKKHLHPQENRPSKFQLIRISWFGGVREQIHKQTHWHPIALEEGCLYKYILTRLLYNMKILQNRGNIIKSWFLITKSIEHFFEFPVTGINTDPDFI